MRRHLLVPDWTVVLLALVSTLAVAAAPATAGINRWTSLGPEDAPGAEILELLIDAERPDIVYSTVARSSSFRSVDGGRTWASLGDTLPTTVRALAQATADPRLLFAGTSIGVYRSVDRGLSWTGPLSFFGDRPPAVSGLAIDPADPGRVIAVGTTRVIPIPVSFFDVTTDGGATWSRSPAPVDVPEAVAIDPRTPEVVVVAGYGIARSTDGGGSWEQVLAAFPPDREARFLTSLEIAPSDPSVLYAASPTLLPDVERLFKSTDGGLSWFVPSHDLDELAVMDLAVDPQSPEIVYAATSEGVWLSRDGSVTWESLGALDDEVTTLAAHPLFPRTIYAGTDASGVHKLTRSTADGCAPGEALCLHGDRFHVEVAFRDFAGRSGRGQAERLTEDSGYFWFFDPDNVEVTLKALDGRGFNDHFWVFYASLSNVRYIAQVTDTVTERVRAYLNPAGSFASVGDIEAFPGDGGLSRGPHPGLHADAGR
jgi:photosystem II stability/assembly factor-like uncharacterized protein